ncbi:phage tail protein [Rhodopseudomonas sp. BR0G17]|uniref:phage tail protein n=1 Tax=Rhodopseudomonas sp. BR0G17 TaxID=2269368 RepID=UPI0013E03C43|nr:phage tail protein [Rhodopseudomonas sp. BR0G17]NEW96912.1 hypothetical protein [Rhodopseudomonas sp. BR0G17]
MTDTVATALPSNASPFLRAMAEVLDARAPLSDQVPRLGEIGTVDFPDDWLPWLVIHHGLDRIAPYVGDLLKTILEGRSWQRVRGTPAATEGFVLDWLGLVGLDVPDGCGGAGPIEEERIEDVKWWLYQIALAEAPETLPVVKRLIGADDLSRNAGTVCGRIYGGYDVRALRLDGGRLDDAMLDNWSGVVLPEIGSPRLSFGRFDGCLIDAAIADPIASAFTDTAILCRFDGGFVLDRSRLDDEVLDLSFATVEPGFIADTSTQVTAAGAAPWPRSAWPGVPWSQLDYFVYGGAD